MSDLTYGFKRFYIRDGQLFSKDNNGTKPHQVGQWEQCDNPIGFYFTTKLELQSLPLVNTCGKHIQAIYMVAARGSVRKSNCEASDRQADEVYIIEQIDPAFVLLFGRFLNWELLDPERVALRESKPWIEQESIES